MADQTPPNDPLDNRLRATFTAERDDIERRHLAGGAAPAQSRSLKWIPFAVAAAVIAIAGFAFIGNRSNDQAVELDVAAQTPDGLAPDGQAPDGQAAPTTGVAVAVNGSEQPAQLPDPTPVAALEAAANNCPGVISTTAHFVWDVSIDDPDGGLVAHTGPGADEPITQVLGYNAVVYPTGACTPLPDGNEWYELVADNGNTEWVNARYLKLAQPGCLITTDGEEVVGPTSGVGVVVDAAVFFVADSDNDQPTDRYRQHDAGGFTFGRCAPVAPVATDCIQGNIPPRPHFVWNVAIDDPDGGLIAHSDPGADAPVTRVLDHNAVVMPAGGCFKTENGAEWYEIAIPAVGSDWVNSRFLKSAEPFCLQGESIGVERQSDVRASDTMHTVVPGETIDDIAATYNVTAYSILETNPSLDPASLEVGSMVRISNGTAAGTLFQGPLDSWGIRDGDAVAYVAPKGPLNLIYFWHPADGFRNGGDCSGTASAGSRLCLTGDISLRSGDDGPVVWTGIGPVVAWQTGTTSGALLEVELLDPAGDLVTGFVDRSTTTGRCFPGGGDSLADQPCTRLAQPTTLRSSLIAGQRDPAADHVHGIRAESSEECTRLVVEFGVDANEDSDTAAPTMPLVRVDFDAESVIVTPTGPLWEGAFGDPHRVDYPEGVGLLVVSSGFKFSVQFRHLAMEPHVRFMSNPARVVIDLFPIDDEASNPLSSGPFGDNFVLREPIQRNLTGPGIEPGNGIVVSGYGRPFEASGLYRIWSVPTETDPDVFFANPPAPLIENFFPTSSWADGWGEFSVPLPDLAPGTYIAVFGELPPTDEIGFYGTGQLFRIAGPDDPADVAYPPAVLLPDVQLPPE